LSVIARSATTEAEGATATALSVVAHRKVRVQRHACWHSRPLLFFGTPHCGVRLGVLAVDFFILAHRKGRRTLAAATLRRHCGSVAAVLRRYCGSAAAMPQNGNRKDVYD
jgi:hypothetical protein